MKFLSVDKQLELINRGVEEIIPECWSLVTLLQ